MPYNSSNYSKTYWKRNKERLLAQRRERYKNNNESRDKALACGKRVRARNLEYLYKLLSSSKCLDCDESDMLVLELDHCRGSKVKEVTSLANSAVSIQALKDEIDKCDIVCANCHRRRTFNRRPGNTRLQFISTLSI